MFERKNVYVSYVNKWHNKPAAVQTYANFKQHFTLASKNYNRKLTVKAAGFDETALAAKMAKQTITKMPQPPTKRKKRPPYAKVDTICLYYCWTCRLSPHRTHTSQTCRRPAKGHQKEATLRNTMGGSNAFWVFGMD